ncbi:SHOCT domain-containing protein [Streptomyces sp. NBC_00190]|uniref:SHOCT domain-containing protein n=1 Tax=unclassified Streptomyces TaxID=2593676 RepID=UPI002E29B8E0|nr:SHOCT domain-containing protein [Streptomyces sp. NBC_00190]WSZ42401.1 SHOCT domain-containing protein [Streptomyces sp. NBC_00868]
MRSADRPPGRPLLRGLLARAVGATEGTVRADEPRHGVRWTPAGAVEPVEAEPEPEAWEAERAEPEWEPEAGSPVGMPPGGATPPAGLVAELRQLADLAREGLLTPEEFATAKSRLLRG